MLNNIKTRDAESVNLIKAVKDFVSNKKMNATERSQIIVTISKDILSVDVKNNNN
jgi:hypothetical protein